MSSYRSPDQARQPACAKAILKTSSPEMTVELGRRIGGALRPGDTVLLEGGLGAGKTVLARGILLGLGVGEGVPARSPTFTLIHEYKGRFAVRHADLYRVEPPEEIETIGLFDEGMNNGVTIIEWADRLAEGERKGAVTIKIRDISLSERELEIIASPGVLASAGLGPGPGAD